ncbi:MAG: helix-turn-helix domain-containing protein [Rhodococcus sp. (in: high G+C Gram-positive bacteria)]|nr:helix-turn-helix domain-containing protein [Rhodococcus sp. (in: high G+C Gram-positive bacteria)]
MANRSSARDDMLRSAADLFRRRGVDATSLADVIDHAGAPRGSIYHHFPRGKPQLVEEATRTVGAAMGAMISAGLTAAGPAATVRAFIEGFRGELLATDFVAGCPVAPAALEGLTAPGAVTAAGESFSSWEDTIAASLWQRGVARERSHALATFAIAAIEGALIMSKAQRSTTALDRTEGELSALLEAVLEASASR